MIPGLSPDLGKIIPCASVGMCEGHPCDQCGLESEETKWAVGHERVNIEKMCNQDQTRSSTATTQLAGHWFCWHRWLPTMELTAVFSSFCVPVLLLSFLLGVSVSFADKKLRTTLQNNPQEGANVRHDISKLFKPWIYDPIPTCGSILNWPSSGPSTGRICR